MRAEPVVIVVDDDRPTAEEYARLITQATGLDARFTDEPEHAVELVRNHPISVVVLDQQMPVSGTDLFIRLRAEDPRIRAILLTAHATEEEVGTALNLGFKRYLKKQNVVQSLPLAILHEYTEYQAELLALDVATTQPVIYRRKHHRWSRNGVVYRLLKITTLHGDHVFEKDWTEVLTLQAGQTERHKIGITVEHRVVVDEESSASLKGALSLDDKKFTGLATKLESQLTSSFKRSTTRAVIAQNETERTFQLASEPADVSTVHVRARRVQQAPVYQMIRVDLHGECGCCGHSHIVPVIMHVATGAVALRHIDQMSDGSSVVVSLGSTPAT